MDPLNNVPQNVSTLLRAAGQREQTSNEIAVAVAVKQQDATKQAGAAIDQLLSQAAELGRQLAEGRLDVRA